MLTNLNVSTIVEIIDAQKASHNSKITMLQDLSDLIACDPTLPDLVSLEDCLNILSDKLCARQVTWLSQIFTFDLI